jgi:acetate kinase
MRIMVLNSGSSSIRYQLFDMSGGAVLASGIVEQIGEEGSRLRHRSGKEAAEIARAVSAPDHREGFQQITAALSESGSLDAAEALFGIGHRVVHGGEVFKQPTLIDDDVIAAIREQIPLAPLHNPANIIGIEVARARMPDVPQVAVFDTAFHQTIPPPAYHYALPFDLHEEHHVRRYGFHGTSHCHVAGRAAEYLERPLASLNLITLHLGNGASATAIQAGRSVDTSMGMTPLEGLIMGTRAGDLDPAIPFFLARATGRPPEGVEALLNTESGLKGICGVNDMRTIQRRAAEGDERSQLATEMYAYRIRKYIGAYSAVLGRVDAIVFTAGIGENSPEIRASACRGLSALGIEIDPARNADASREVREIQPDGAALKVLVVPTNEELEIAQETLATIRALPERRRGSR